MDQLLLLQQLRDGRAQLAQTHNKIVRRREMVQHQQSLRDEIERERVLLMDEEKALMEHVQAIRRDIEQVSAPSSVLFGLPCCVCMCHLTLALWCGIAESGRREN